jgi:hypothetical protein
MSEAIGSILERRKASIELKRVSTNSNSIEPAAGTKNAAPICPGLEKGGNVNGSWACQATRPEPANKSYPSQGDIPNEIDALIDNKLYRNKFKLLIRQGHLNDLLELARVARDKKAPSRWFAVVTAKKNWKATLAFLAELRHVKQLVHQVTSRIHVPQTSVRAVYKACWKFGESTIQKAVCAAEIGRDPFRLFCWLCYSSAGSAGR